MNVISKEVEELNTFSINQESGQEQFHIANLFDVQHWRSWMLTFESWASITASKDKLPSYARLVMLWLDQNPYNVAQMANGKKIIWWILFLNSSKVLHKIGLIVNTNNSNPIFCYLWKYWIDFEFHSRYGLLIIIESDNYIYAFVCKASISCDVRKVQLQKHFCSTKGSFDQQNCLIISQELHCKVNLTKIISSKTL